MEPRLTFLVLAVAAIAVLFGTGVGQNITGYSIFDRIFNSINRPNAIDAIHLCTDSDGGVNPTTQGYVTDMNSTTRSLRYHNDTCIDSAHVREYSCTGTTLATNGIRCTTGSICVDGACRPSSTLYYCTDSDGGQTPGTTGTVTIMKGRWIMTHLITDICIDNNHVLEGYCRSFISSDGTPTRIILPCPTGQTCSAGRCGNPGTIPNNIPHPSQAAGAG